MVIQKNEQQMQVTGITKSLLSEPFMWLSHPYIHAASSYHTRQAYRSDIRHYENWGGLLPATSESIARYLTFYATRLNPRTLSRRLVAIKHWHTHQGFSDPTQHLAIAKIIKGILRVHGQPKNKAHPITLSELSRMTSYLQNQNSLAAVRDQALLQIGFFGAFRRSELVSIQYQHIQWQKVGIEIILPSSKTDQTHTGQYVVIPYGNDMLCPIRSLQNWIKLACILHGPIFRRIISEKHLGGQLSPLSVNHILKSCAQKAGLNNIEQISSHSLRRGLATCAAQAGSPLHVIMRAGRWKQTQTVMEYIEASERLSDNAAAHVLKQM